MHNLILITLFIYTSVARADISVQLLQKEIESNRGTSFQSLLNKWEKQYGTNAIPSLLKIASHNKNDDKNRYIALMGVARLGGKESAVLIMPFLKDKSWMIRSAGLRALRILNNPKTADAVLPLLNDPALVVRAEAVEAVEKLNPNGAPNSVIDALISAAENSANYHNGKAQWIPQKVLSALVTLKAISSAQRLLPLLEHKQDPEFQKHVVQTLEALTLKNMRGKTLEEQIRQWKETVSQ